MSMYVLVVNVLNFINQFAGPIALKNITTYVLVSVIFQQYKIHYCLLLFLTLSDYFRISSLVGTA